VGGHIKNKIL